jgi:indolepyruvate ferredoxin oxidoreductase beta subunit
MTTHEDSGDHVTNIVIAGLGGQGVLKSSDMLAYAAFLSGRDVKKAEIHGMSQRGGSVTSDIRFGKKVLSPMVPEEQADYLVVLEDTQVEPSQHRLAANGTLLQAASIDKQALPTSKALNVAMLGMLSVHLDLPESSWQEAIKAFLPSSLHEANETAFEVGRTAAEKEKNNA